jgi:hypothetical protein
MESLELISISRAGNPHLAFLGVVYFVTVEKTISFCQLKPQIKKNRALEKNGLTIDLFQ